MWTLALVFIVAFFAWIAGFTVGVSFAVDAAKKDQK